LNAVGFGLRVTLVGLSAWNLLTAGAVMMIQLTIPWQVMQTTGSPVLAGLSVAVELAAFSVSCLLGTPLAERVGYRATVALSGLLSAGAVLAIPLLHLGFGQMLMAVALFGLARAPGQNTVLAMTPDLAAGNGISLHRMAIADEYGRQLFQAGGMVLAGVLIAGPGSSTALAVAGTVIAAVTILTATILAALLVPVHPKLTSGLSYTETLWQMVAVPVGRSRVTSMLMLLALGVGLADVFVLIPVYASDVLHSPTALGLMAGLMAVGLMVGSALHDWLGPITSVGLVAVFVLVGSARYGVLAIQPGLTLILVTMVIAGLVAGPTEQEPALSRYARIPPAVRTLAIGAATGKQTALGPPCLLLAGVAVAGIGLTASLWVLAGLTVVLTFGFTFTEL
jgi:MFS family permease